MQIGSATLEKKLLSYSLAAGAVLAGTGDVNAGIWCTAVNKVLNLSETLTISFNGNSRFILKNTGTMYRYPVGKIQAQTSKAFWYGRVKHPYALGGSFNANSTAIRLLPNGVVGTNLAKPAYFRNFVNRNAAAEGLFIFGSYSFGGGADRYIGVKFNLTDGTHYGWIKLNGAIRAASWTVVSYAYETTPNTPITCDGTLPVELTSFNAAVDGSSVGLKWNTATEVNNHGFEIERKFAQNVEWEKIGFVEGHGNSNSPLDYSYSDANAPKGNLTYRLKQIDNDGKYTYSDVVKVANNTVENFELAQNYPNPFNPSTKIKFSLPEKSAVSLKVFNSLGQEVSTLINKELEAGIHEADFNASGLPSGVYVYKISASKYSAVKKMLMIK